MYSLFYALPILEKESTKVSKTGWLKYVTSERAIPIILNV
jgi:hypothetical protein